MRKTLFTLLLSGIIGLASVAHAVVSPVFAGPGTGGVLRDDYTAVGFGFTAPGADSRDLIVHSLGVWDEHFATPALGLAYAVPVQLTDWTTPGTISITVTQQAPLIGEFRYVDFPSPVSLQRGHFYTVEAVYTPSGGVRWHQAGNFALDPNTTVTGLDARFGGPNLAAGFNAFLGPNLLAEAVPEPGTLWLLGLGGLALWRCRRA